MSELWRDFQHNPFLLTGLIAGVLGGVACGLVGPYVITRRIVLLSGAVAHAALGGVGLALFLGAVYPQLLPGLQPLHGAALFALGAAALIGYCERRFGQLPDTLIAAVWSVGMALGVLLAKFTPGYQSELMNYLFGNISYVSWRQVGELAALNLIIIAVVAVLHKRLLAICLDPEQAELQSVNVTMMNVILMMLVALTVICLTQIVGLVLVITLLSLPAATAAQWVRRMGPMMLVSGILCCLETTVPRLAVYGTPVSAEAAIVLTAAAVYLAALAFQQLWHWTGPRRRITFQDMVPRKPRVLLS